MMGRTKHEFLQRVRMARHAERCTSYTAILSVRLSVRHTPVLWPDE